MNSGENSLTPIFCSEDLWRSLAFAFTILETTITPSSNYLWWQQPSTSIALLWSTDLSKTESLRTIYHFVRVRSITLTDGISRSARRDFPSVRLTVLIDSLFQLVKETDQSIVHNVSGTVLAKRRHDNWRLKHFPPKSRYWYRGGALWIPSLKGPERR